MADGSDPSTPIRVVCTLPARETKLLPIGAKRKPGFESSSPTSVLPYLLGVTRLRDTIQSLVLGTPHVVRRWGGTNCWRAIDLTSHRWLLCPGHHSDRDGGRGCCRHKGSERINKWPQVSVPACLHLTGNWRSIPSLFATSNGRHTCWGPEGSEEMYGWAVPEKAASSSNSTPHTTSFKACGCVKPHSWGLTQLWKALILDDEWCLPPPIHTLCEVR